MDTATGRLPGIVSALGVVIAAIVAALSGNFGWRASVAKDIDLFYKMFPLSDNFDEDLILERLRVTAFLRVEKGLAGPSRNVKTFAWFFIANSAVIAAWSLSTGRYEEHPWFAFYDALVEAVMALLYVGLLAVLRRHPKVKWNPYYQEERRRIEVMELVRKSRELIEKCDVESMWFGNYYHYKQAKKAEWGYRRPSGKGERKRRDPGQKVDCGGEDDVNGYEHGDEIEA